MTAPVLHAGIIGMGILALMVTPLASAPDLDHGERQFNRMCKTCHTVGAGEPHRQGPNLHGMFDREAGTTDFSGYSYNMRRLGFEWDDESLDRYLAEGRGFVRGTTMRMANMRDEEDRRAIIAYLRRVTE